MWYHYTDRSTYGPCVIDDAVANDDKSLKWKVYTWDDDEFDDDGCLKMVSIRVASSEYIPGVILSIGACVTALYYSYLPAYVVVFALFLPG